ncbi:MAG: SpoIVB peptidase [Clostridiales bacterium]|nr:SpoIVB peptidase [Clostridiales bacterium]
MKKNLPIFVAILLLLVAVFTVFFVARNGMTQTVSTKYVASNQDLGGFIGDVSDLFVNGSSSKINEEVYLGGYPLGITIDGDGVTVIGLNEFVAADGTLCCPALNAGIEINDVIVELNGRKIYGSAKLSEIAAGSNGQELPLKYLRQGVMKETTITPVKDLTSGQYRLGLWTRDSSSGIGTLTYVRKNLKFGSLGHPITDAKGSIITCKNGGVFDCTIDGIEKGQKGAAGELKGGFCFDRRIGNIYANNKFGAFGTFNTLPQFCDNAIEVADISEIKPGKAQIYCTLGSEGRKCYDIEIVKVTPQSSRDDKGMVIHVTDPELLEKTGGIVQGMSGSPIVQNGKLVGAVTHVFVNDPTRGYGIYAKWMMTN